MPTIINGNTGIDQVTNNTLVVADAKSGEVVGFQKMQLFASKATTSGTFVDFSPADGTGIPSWAKKITLTMVGLSTNGTANLLAQIGAGSIDTSGYDSRVFQPASTWVTGTAGILLTAINSASAVVTGTITFTKVDGNNWTMSVFNTTSYGTGTVHQGTCTKLLSGALDRIRLTTANGTDLFDGPSGIANILVEGYE